MNFTDLKTELFARGTNYLEESAAEIARGERWLNQAYREILALHAWPFLRTSATGSAGTGVVAIADLRRVLAVENGPGSPLQRVSLEDLIYQGADRTKTGTPEKYWIDNSATIRAFPVGGTITVYYIKRVEPLTGTDVPIFDEEYHDLIVDKAMMKAYKDTDNFEALAALKVEFNEGVTAMAEDYMIESRDVQYVDPHGSDMGYL